MIRIELPWPDRDLHPNARVHWSRRQRAAKRDRTLAGWKAKQAGAKPLEAAGVAVAVTFTPPDHRRRDTDGMLGNTKSFLDGIADVIGVDDSKWSLSIRREAPAKPGRVVVEIE